MWVCAGPSGRNQRRRQGLWVGRCRSPGRQWAWPHPLQSWPAQFLSLQQQVEHLSAQCDPPSPKQHLLGEHSSDWSFRAVSSSSQHQAIPRGRDKPGLISAPQSVSDSNLAGQCLFPPSTVERKSHSNYCFSSNVSIKDATNNFALNTNIPLEVQSQGNLFYQISSQIYYDQTV